MRKADVRHPRWLVKRAPDPAALARMKRLLDGLRLHTVCESARCPNQGECFALGTATFMILGEVCTRNCTFCGVAGGSRGGPVDFGEPERVATAAERLGLRYVVVTSVTRDDLPDVAAGQFAATIRVLHRLNPGVKVEVLVPDFQGSLASLQTVIAASPQVLGHNVETVPRLYPEVRPGAAYERSLQLLERAKALNPALVTKSGLMVGMGEAPEEVFNVLDDLVSAGCDLVTIGQYLPPSPAHHPLARYVPPQEFDQYAAVAVGKGFRGVASAPLARSSFEAAAMFEAARPRLELTDALTANEQGSNIATTIDRGDPG